MSIDTALVKPQAVIKLLASGWLFELLAFVTPIFFMISVMYPLSMKLVKIISNLDLGLVYIGA